MKRLGFLLLLLTQSAASEPLANIFDVTPQQSPSASQRKQTPPLFEQSIIQSPVLRVRLNNETFDFKSTKTLQTQNKQRVWLGATNNKESLSLIQSDFGLSGHIRAKGKVWNLRKYGQDDYFFVQNKDIPELEQNDDVAALEAYQSSSNDSSAALTFERHSAMGFQDTNEIKILVYYSQYAKSQYPNIEDLIALEFEDTNAALAASNIDATVTAVALVEIEDSQQDDNLFDMREHLGAYQTLPSLRNKYAADLVHFFGSRIGFVCGKAWYAANRSGWSEDEYGYGVTSMNCFGNMTFAHEIGHNLGAKHDRYVEAGGDDYFNYGYSDVDNAFRTIMSYTNECSENGVNCNRINFFSNPDVLYAGEHPVGTAIDSDTPEHNALMINQTANIIANFRGVGAPIGLDGSYNDGNQQLELSWQPFEGADSYQIYHQYYDYYQCQLDQNENTLTLLDTVTEASATIDTSGLTQGNHCFFVKALKTIDWIDAQQVSVKSLTSTEHVTYIGQPSDHLSKLDNLVNELGEPNLSVNVTVDDPSLIEVNVLSASMSGQFSIQTQSTGNDVTLNIENNFALDGFAQIQVKYGADAVRHFWVISNGFENQAPAIDIVDAITVPQNGQATINYTITDELDEEFVHMSVLSSSNTVFDPRSIEIGNGELRIALDHELVRDGQIFISAFDGENLTSETVTVTTERTLFNEPIVPDSVVMYVQGMSPLKRRIPGLDIDGDSLSYSVSAQPSAGSVLVEDDQFTYYPNDNFSTDSFTMTVQDETSEEIHTVDINLEPLPEMAIPYRQNVLVDGDKAAFLTHRGDLYRWGFYHGQIIPTPELNSSGWVDFAMTGAFSILLKADGTLWYDGQSYRYPGDDGQTDYLPPTQLGTDRDWVALFGKPNFTAVFALKYDGSLWVLSHYWSLGNLPEQFSDQAAEDATPIQANALYHWKSVAPTGEIALMLDNQGQVWSAGETRFRSLMRPSREGYLSPIDSDIVGTDVFASAWRGFVNTEEGIYAWGDFNFLSDFIGRGEASNSSYFEASLVNTQQWQSVSLSDYGFIGVDNENKLFTSSTLSRPYLGKGPDGDHYLTQVGNDENWVVGYSSDTLNYAIDLTGQMYVAGEAEYSNGYVIGFGDNSDTSFDTFVPLTTIPADITGMTDFDGDRILAYIDTDDDNDGVIDSRDDAPDDDAIANDNDGDGIDDSIDPDDDNDGVPDVDDAFPLDPTEWEDTDNDGIGNNADQDDDNDGVADVDDLFPLDPTEWADFDMDGIGNNADPDDDNDGVNDDQDAFPYDASEWLDTDSDGIGNNADEDDDNDGVNDDEDAFPLDSTESVDTDNDGIGNNADPDDDNDGVEDGADAFPLDASETTDTDGDGIGNNADNDDDNDGVPDASDAYPLDPNRSERPSSNSDSGGGSMHSILLLLLGGLLLRRRSTR